MEKELKVRLADETDAINISQILESAFIEFKDKYTKKAFDATVISPAEVKARMKNSTSWIATFDNQLLGTATGRITTKTLYIQGMAVVPEARGKRIGYSILKTIEEFAKNNKCELLLLSTTPYLSRAISLYKQFGFEIINNPPYELFGIPLFTMKKNIK